MNDGQNDNMAGMLMSKSTIIMEQTPNYIKLAIPKQSRRPHSDLKLVDARNGVYEVAKSNVFEYAMEKLSDGSIVTVMRRMPIAYAERVKLHAAAVAAGLKVKPLEAEKAKAEGEFAARVNIADLQ